VTGTFPYLLLPHIWSSRNRALRRERGDGLRAGLFAAVGLIVCAALFYGAYWLTRQLAAWDELGDFMLRVGLSWLFLTFLAFLAFSGVVTSLSTFFLADDLRLLVAAPVAPRRLFHARFARTVVQSSWMVAVFLMPVLAGVGLARAAPPVFYLLALLTVVPFVTIPVVAGAACTLLLVNVFPARRARDLLMLMGFVFAGAIVILLRFIRPEQLLRVDSLPDVTGFFATLQSPITPLLPSFWAGEALFSGLQGGPDWLHHAALWSTAAAFLVMLRAADERWHFAGYSRSQEAPKARFAHLAIVDRAAGLLPVSPVRRQLLVKDLKIFLRDVSQWSQLLLLVALVLVYLYNFRVLDLNRIPYMAGFVKNVYAFVNIGLAGFVMATVCVRFVFPAVSAEGNAFWIIRTAPISFRDFLWSKFWIGVLPVMLLTEGLVVSANEFLNVDPFLKVVAAGAIVCLSFAFVGLATGLGARYPRFGADANQAAGSYGGIAFMILAVLLIIVMVILVGWPSSIYLFRSARRLPLSGVDVLQMAAGYMLAVAVTCATWLLGMRTGIAALNAMRR
jgi:ABC-2 type transport system permease protein